MGREGEMMIVVAPGVARWKVGDVVNLAREGQALMPGTIKAIEGQVVRILRHDDPRGPLRAWGIGKLQPLAGERSGAER